MRVSQLETFFWAGKLGSFTHAARKLNASNSTVSMRVRELEAALGVTLFDRSRRSAHLTTDGVFLLPIAEQILLAADRMRNFRHGTGRGPVHLRLGVVESIAMTWLTPMIGRVHRELPGIRIDVEIGLSYLLEERLAKGLLDAIMAPCSMSPADYSHAQLGAVRFYWMCSPQLDLPNEIAAEHFGAFPLIVTSREQQFRGTLLEWANRHKVRIANPIICNTMVVSSKLAEAGLEIAYLPLPIFSEQVATGRLVIIKARPEPMPMDHFFIRPLSGQEEAVAAVQEFAVQSSSFAEV